MRERERGGDIGLTGELLVNRVSLLHIIFQIIDCLATEFEFNSFILSSVRPRRRRKRFHLQRRLDYRIFIQDLFELLLMRFLTTEGKRTRETGRQTE
jgi:hypothetical protein